MGTVTGKRLMIAGTGSGCGKTTAVCAILYGLKKQGFAVEAWKSGPDYIDPMFHRRVLGSTSGNLDLYFSGADGVRRLLAQRIDKADIGIVEGAMGYYDGIGMTGRAGCHELAEAAGLPVVLVVSPQGMGNSVGALLQGFLQYRQPSHIAGVLFNRVSASRYEQLRPLAEKLGLSGFRVLEDGRIRIYEEGVSVEGLAGALSEAGAGVLSIGRRRETLEEYFLKLVGEGLQ